MADLGSISLFLAFLASLAAMFGFWGCGRKGHPTLLATAKWTLFTNFGLVSLAVLALLGGLLAHDFSMEYVASYSSLSMSPVYLISALWAGNSGSMLLWAWLLSLAAFIFYLTRKRDRTTIAYASAILMLTEAFFLLILVSVSGPFGKITPPVDGQGLNPMLQNPGMVVHPPALLAGYVLLAVPFALAMAAMITGTLKSDWTKTARSWMLAAWLLLGAGNIIGAWWAYVELGWGGYWAWDPVENAGLMPWLVATAFLHSAIVQRRRGMMKFWTMSLVIMAFLLSIFGTYLTRSGIINSVHTFGDSQMGPFFVVFLLIMLVWSVYMVYERRRELRSEAEMQSLISRETSFLLTNLLLVGSMVIILLGTLFPAISELTTGSSLTLSGSFFNRVDVPLFLVIILLAGVCTLMGWQQVVLKKLGRDLILPLVVALAVAVLRTALGAGSVTGVVVYSLAAFVVVSILRQWISEIRARSAARHENAARSLAGQLSGNRSRYGAFLVHLALAVMAIGVAGSSLFGLENEGNLKTGQSLSIGGYSLVYQSSQIDHQANQTVVRVTMSVSRDGRQIATVYPEKYYNVNFNQPVTEVAIRSNLAEDLYVILGDPNSDGSVYFKVLLNPLVDWIWIGGVLVVVGGLLVFWPEKTSAPEPAPAPQPVPQKGGPQKQKESDIEDEIEAEVKRLRRRRKS